MPFTLPCIVLPRLPSQHCPSLPLIVPIPHYCSSLTVLPNFAQRVDVAVEALSSTPGKEVDENEFIDASHLVYDGVREIRMAVLMNKADDELDPDDVLMDDYHTLEIRSKCKCAFACCFAAVYHQVLKGCNFPNCVL